MKQQNNRLFISFSGGETSGYMTWRLLQENTYKDTKIIFANTGQESEATLEFIDRCDKEFNLNVVWVEAVPYFNQRKSSGHKVVTFETASRDGTPYEEMIKKYGISNKASPHCTRELKLNAMTSYVRSLGWGKNSYDTAIGIRIDEMQRVSQEAILNRGIIYPLIDWKVSKKEVREFWERQSFRLQIKEHEGNCTWCWKKSLRKLLTLAVESPSIFEFPARMELEYPKAGTNKSEEHNRVFFRNNMGTKELLELSKQPFEPFTDTYRVSLENFNEDLDSAGGCSESCEIFSI
jgi:3'-phosphoadenosine 5'-phosphosulfate sulfotransferase (PAPS reductase)/FAD synthetase